ncbi:MAG TPA: hypothetical protein PKN57_10900 [Saprospiraceae bacterium]|nr:hypothetical protein [Saprospiraceae bacterium]HMV23809.1 hypothetical protein [Saprospiraceae bacterium]HMX84202.1 hypothetical protein [Saprospiraceae bacterium]HMX85355.1 hypothetical protein [Saprospiraceae bacterium]HMZ74082.1 hypothetical protein [Saprospiraceae bacterium]
MMNSNEKLNIYKQAQRFADVTKKLIITGNVKRAKRCLNVASNLMEKGNKEIQNAISNVYVYSLSSFMELHHCAIKNFFPKNLQNEYHNQINASGL